MSQQRQIYTRPDLQTDKNFTSKMVFRFQDKVESKITYVTQDSDNIAVGTDKGEVYLIAKNKGGSLTKKFNEHTSAINCMQFRDGVLFSLAENGKLKIFDTEKNHFRVNDLNYETRIKGTDAIVTSFCCVYDAHPGDNQ